LLPFSACAEAKSRGQTEIDGASYIGEAECLCPRVLFHPRLFAQRPDPSDGSTLKSVDVSVALDSHSSRRAQLSIDFESHTVTLNSVHCYNDRATDCPAWNLGGDGSRAP